MSQPPTGKRKKLKSLEWENIPPLTNEQISEENESLAKITRIKLLSSVTLNAAVCQTDADGLANIIKTIEISDSNSAPESTIKSWRLQDNSVRSTTLAELRKIKQLHDVQFVAVWDAFNTWHDTDKFTPFSYAPG